MANLVTDRRWYHLTPDRFVILLLAVEGFLLLSEGFNWWFACRLPKNMMLLIALETVGLGVLIMLLSFLASLFTGRYQFTRLFSGGRFQIGLRSLLLMVVVLAIPCGWLKVRIEQANRQREAVEAIKKLGGAVEYNYAGHGSAWHVVGVILLLPAGMLCGQGTDFYVEADRVFGGRSVTNAELEHLDTLTTLTSVDLRDTNITDTGLEHLKGLSKLQTLDLHGTKVTDAGLERLKGLTTLRSLSLYSTKVTDAGLVHLQGLSQLDVLYLSNTQVTDAGLRHLKGLTHLHELDLRHTQAMDKGLEELQQALPNCRIER
jgi:hypothetical protein